MVTPVLTLNVVIGSVIFGGDTYLLLFCLIHEKPTAASGLKKCLPTVVDKI